MKSTFFTAAATLFAVVSTVSAQDNTTSSSNTTNIVIQVGKGGQIFTPNSVNATNGTVITFEFTGSPGNHSVTQSTFSNPCQPIGNGFDSGWVFVPNLTTSGFPSWNLTVTNDQKPLWFYCKQLEPTPHCDNGMVGAINAPVINNTFDEFLAAAKNQSGPSGQGIGALVGQGASASANPGPLTGSITLFGAPTPASNSSSSSPTNGTSSGNGTAGGSGSGGGNSGAMGLAVAPIAFTVVFGAIAGALML